MCFYNKKFFQRCLPYVVSVCILLGILGCCKIPRESVELSYIVGQQIVAMQVSHEAFVKEYFDLSRERIDDFIVERWLPKFMEDFVGKTGFLSDLENPQVLTEEQKQKLREEFKSKLSLTGDQLDEAVKAVNSGLGDAERGQIALDFAQAATEEISKQRQELMGQVDKLERQALDEIRKAYAQLIQSQSTVTAYIESAHKVKVEQDRVLEELRLLEARDKALDKVVLASDKIVGITRTAKTVEEAIEKIAELSVKGDAESEGTE